MIFFGTIIEKSMEKMDNDVRVWRIKFEGLSY